MNTTARHADAELSLSSKAPAKPSDGGKSRQQKNEELAAAASAMRERNAAAAAEQADTEQKASAPPPREDVESIEWQLTDGRKVVFGPPPGISITMRIAMQFPEAAVNPLLAKLVRVMLSVRSVDGKAPKPITNMIELTAMANALGDVAIDELAMQFDQFWGDVRLSDLQLLKKNLR